MEEIDNKYKKSITDITELIVGSKHVLVIPKNFKRNLAMALHSKSFDTILCDAEIILSNEESLEVAYHLDQHGKFERF